MPTYHYRCTLCGHSFDQFQKFSEEPLTECPECQGLIKRVLQPVGIVFKGSGWYINDSRDSTTSAKSESSKNGDAGSAPKTESKTPAKESKATEPVKAAAASEG